MQFGTVLRLSQSQCNLPERSVTKSLSSSPMIYEPHTPRLVVGLGGAVRANRGPKVLTLYALVETFAVEGTRLVVTDRVKPIYYITFEV